MNLLALLARVERAIGRFNRWFAASAVAANTEQGRTINAMDVKALQGEIKTPVAPPKRGESASE
ncbi:MAG TPA: hypothetical protein VJQ08_04230 [Candidatus Dormibacteraeota bacterium]|nr:hypothetical protein [Candidatus Dormibacteraeota bacterium]